MKDVYDDGSVLILYGDDLWMGDKNKPTPIIILFEVEKGVYLIEKDSTCGEAFRQLESMSSTSSFYFNNSNDFYMLDDMAFMMLRMVL